MHENTRKMLERGLKKLKAHRDDLEEDIASFEANIAAGRETLAGVLAQIADIEADLA